MLLYQSVSVSQELLTFHPLMFHLSACSVAAQNWKTKSLQNCFTMYLNFLISDWKFSYVTRFIANSIPLLTRLPLRCAWTRSSCWVMASLSSRARLPVRHVSGIRPHTQHEKAHVRSLPQAAPLPGMAPGIFQHPLSPWAQHPASSPGGSSAAVLPASLLTKSWIWWGKNCRF